MEEPARPVKAMVLEATDVRKIREFPGIVKPAREVNLAFRVSGPLVRYDLRVGQRVEKGEVIARIDRRDYAIRVERLGAALDEERAGLKVMKKGARREDVARLEAELAATRSRFADALRDFQRQKSLLEENAASRAEYDKTETALDTARASVEVVEQELKIARTGARMEDIEAAEARIRSLEADMKEAKNALADTRLSAPFSGYINRKYAEEHETVSAGKPVLSLLDFSTIEVKTSVSEEVVTRRKDISDLSCILTADPALSIPATLKEIGRQTDSANQSYPMTMVLHGAEDLDVTPGMAATVRVVLKEDGPQATDYFLPAAALFADADGRPCVWRIDPQTMCVGKTPVTTGGLHAGDLLAIAGTRFLREDQKVRILDQGKKARL
jgi:multidrug resistance efflux pump